MIVFFNGLDPGYHLYSKVVATRCSDLVSKSQANNVFSTKLFHRLHVPESVLTCTSSSSTRPRLPWS